MDKAIKLFQLFLMFLGSLTLMAIIFVLALLYWPSPYRESQEWRPSYRAGECVYMWSDNEKVHMKIKSVNLEEELYLIEVFDVETNEVIQLELDRDMIEKTRHIFLDICEEKESLTI